MTGVSEDTKGGMYTVVDNYLNSSKLKKNADIKYIPISTVGSIPHRLIFTFKGIIGILKELIFHHYDIIHIHMSEKGSVYRKNIVISISKILNKKIIIHMHGAEFEDWFNTLNPRRRKRVIKIINKGDEIIILGDYWKSFFESVVHDNVKVTRLYNAVPTYRINPYNHNAKSFLFLGALIKRKGIYDLLQAIFNIYDEIPSDITFDLYGPDTSNEIHKKILEFNIQDKVFYHGWLEKNKKVEVLNNTMANILPSYNEGLPMTILETMAFGIPNISTRVAAIPEAIENRVNGILITEGDVDELARAILYFIKNREKLESYSEKSYSQIKRNFSIDTHVEQLLSIYRKLT